MTDISKRSKPKTKPSSMLKVKILVEWKKPKWLLKMKRSIWIV